MSLFARVVYESLRQATGSLVGNKLRTFLSLLGITIGIFCIIAVKSAVDSLRDNIEGSFNKLGSDVIYIDKRPWNEDPGRNYWKYAKRPNPTFNDYKAIKVKSKLAEDAAFTVFTRGRTLKYLNNSVSNALIMAPTYDYVNIIDLKLVAGRYFTYNEYETGANKVILGNKIYNELFKNLDGIGKTVKLFGQNFQVIGYLEVEGESLINFFNLDEIIWINFNTARKFLNLNETSNIGRLLNAKAKPNTELDELKGEIAGILRANRRLKPLELDNFSLNELSMLSQVLDSVFAIINISGFFIGIFALIVGMFSVANIMFVSVKERTSIIGIKKALGAKRYIILLEFLIEAIILCIIGGMMGILLVFVVLKIVSALIPFTMSLSLINIIIGVGASVLVGLISGILPALQASGMDPVEAIRA